MGFSSCERGGDAAGQGRACCWGDVWAEGDWSFFMGKQGVWFLKKRESVQRPPSSSCEFTPRLQRAGGFLKTSSYVPHTRLTANVFLVSAEEKEKC